ncbi:MAG: glycoside hydrolase family 3 N-terminal domain-containing protein [Acidobacteriota bacterium]|nr:glycoside hydrolase family 3 N-terminal domain-containing protein [Acidobacteriota bacterium]
MTTKQKVGQLLVIFSKTWYRAADDPELIELKALAAELGVGGTAVFQGTPRDQAWLVAELQKQADIPLLISQDLEWGAAMRVEGGTLLPSAMAVAASGKTAHAYTMGLITAREARALGVHLAYAPVVDVNNNPDNPVIGIRSFGEDPRRVAELAAAMVKGLHAGGLQATAKHFPGHGDTSVDSHLDLPVLTFDRKRLDQLELLPFRRLIAEGVDSVMVGHLALPELAGNRLPASLSYEINTKLLREDLGFQGLIVTDSLRMQSIARTHDPGEASVLAFLAGADMLLMTGDPRTAYRAVLQAVRSGRISRARLDASVCRILEAKHKAGLFTESASEPMGRIVATREHLAMAKTMAVDSLTLLRNPGDLLPLDENPGRVLLVNLDDRDVPGQTRVFHDALAFHMIGGRITARSYNRETIADHGSLLETAVEKDLIIVATRLKSLNAHHKALFNSLAELPTPTILLNFGSPFLFRHLPPARVELLTYGATDIGQEAAAAALFGKVNIGGRLPVTVPDRYPNGSGLDLPQSRLYAGLPEEAGMASSRLRLIDDLMTACIAERSFPGAAVAVGRQGKLVWSKGYGYHTYQSTERVTPDSIFDLASLTKVIATTSLVMKLYDKGVLKLDEPLAAYLPEFGRGGKEQITVRQIMTHTAGLEAWSPFHRRGQLTRDAVLEYIFAIRPEAPPGTRFRYSDLGMISLWEAMAEMIGEPPAGYLKREVFHPLGMLHTDFRAAGGAGTDPSIVPTEIDNLFRKRLIQGEVHDETAWILGGVAGHAGLFASAGDLARFACAMTSGGVYGKQTVFEAETIARFTTLQKSPPGHTRALGWDTRSLQGYSSSGSFFGPRSYGHTGFTGTSIWIDPDQRLFVILLTNRVHPSRNNSRMREIRAALADIVYGAIQNP